MMHIPIVYTFTIIIGYVHNMHDVKKITLLAIMKQYKNYYEVNCQCMHGN